MSKIMKLQERINKYLQGETTMIQVPRQLQQEFNELSKTTKITMRFLVTEALIIGKDKITKKYGIK